MISFDAWMELHLSLRMQDSRVLKSIDSCEYLLHDLDDIIHVVKYHKNDVAIELLEGAVCRGIKDLALRDGMIPLWRLDEYFGAYSGSNMLNHVEHLLLELDEKFEKGNHVICTGNTTLQVRTPRSFALLESIRNTEFTFMQNLEDEFDTWLKEVNLRTYLSLQSSCFSYMKNKIMLSIASSGARRYEWLKFNFNSLHPSKFMKDITNALFTCIEMVKDGRSELEPYLTGHLMIITDYFIDPKEYFRIGRRNLCQKVAVFDLLLDYRLWISDSLEEHLAGVAQSFPEIGDYGVSRYEGSNIYFVDEQTDLAVAFYRYFALTGCKDYRHKFDLLKDVVFKYFDGSRFYKFYDSLHDELSGDNSKYAFLFGKVLVCDELAEPKEAITNGNIIELLKDR